MSQAIKALTERLARFEPGVRTGRVTRISSTYLEADGPDAPVGAVCAVGTASPEALAVVVSIDKQRVVLVPLVGNRRVGMDTQLRLVSQSITPSCGDAFLGRAIDGLGRPLDGGREIQGQAGASDPVGPLQRVTPRDAVQTGIRAIDGLLALARGQRIGVFAAPGVGKTTLLAQLAAQTSADRCVICLVGERGREVEALWSGLDPASLKRTVVVAATSDETAAMRIQAVEQALALAERWRDEGLHVLLLLDSATRYAMALREVGLAAGEPPTVRAYTPGVFAALPRLVERCGATKRGGAVTAVMTVLSETDDVDDPITEVMKSLLDGHIVLSRRIAEQGRYPAVDIPRSISRLATSVMSSEHRGLAARALALLGEYEAMRTLIDAGVYMDGANPVTDAAIRARPAIEAFLAQPDGAPSKFADTLEHLRRAMGASV